MYSRSVKEGAVLLREQGYSYSYIAETLGIAKSTLGIWLKGVSFAPNKQTLASSANARKQFTSFKRATKAISLKLAETYALQSAGAPSSRELFLLGLGVYIGEGSKTDGITRISNSDPLIIRFMLRWLKESFGLTDEHVRIRVHVYPDSDPQKVLEFWMTYLNLPKESFYPCHVDTRSNKKSVKRGILPYGTVHLGLVSKGNKDLGVLLHRKILATIDRILNPRD